MRYFEDSDYESVAKLLLDYQAGVQQLEGRGVSEYEAINTVSEGVVSAGDPLVTQYNTSSPDALEASVNYIPRVSSTEMELFFSILGNVENMYGIDIPREHILAASRYGFLLKSLVAASLNFYLACKDVTESEVLTPEMKRNFYTSLLILLIEVILVKYPFDYRIAWKGTRFIHNKFLVRVRSILGTEGISVVMKVLHWLGIRGVISEGYQPNSIDSIIDFVVNHGPAVYDRTVSVLDSVEEGFTLGRLEYYGTETRVSLNQSAEEFLYESLLEPLYELLREAGKVAEKDLSELVEAHLPEGDRLTEWQRDLRVYVQN